MESHDRASLPSLRHHCYELDVAQEARTPRRAADSRLVLQEAETAASSHGQWPGPVRGEGSATPDPAEPVGVVAPLDADLQIAMKARSLGPADLRSESLPLEEEALDGGGQEVWLHVYDLGPITSRLNELVLRGVNLGAFHCGIEVLGDEWSFQGFHDAWDDPSLPGIVRHEPRLHPAYIYRESVRLGKTPLSEEAIDSLLDTLLDEWPANTYHLVSRNCVTFAEEFAAALRVPEPFPTWVRGAVDAGKAPPIFAIADYGWSWFKWWSRRQAEQDPVADATPAAVSEGAGAAEADMR